MAFTTSILVASADTAAGTCSTGDQMKVVLLVHNKAEELLRRAVTDFLTPEGRKFIAKNAWWAMHNGHTMTTYPLEEGEPIPSDFRYDWGVKAGRD